MYQAAGRTFYSGIPSFRGAVKPVGIQELLHSASWHFRTGCISYPSQDHDWLTFCALCKNFPGRCGDAVDRQPGELENVSLAAGTEPDGVRSEVGTLRG